MKLIIAGSRGFTDLALLKTEVFSFLDAHQNNFDSQITIICGMARGADLMGKELAECNDWNVIKMPADWDRFGKSAGYRRNEEMAKIADACIVFWDGKSKGSLHMQNLAKEYNLILRVVKYV